MHAGERYRIAATGPSDIRRIEAGILNYGIDMTLEDNPYEVGLERLVDLDKPTPFIGKEALERIRREGVRRRLVGVEIEGTRLELNMTRYPVLEQGRAIGQVTSAVYSPRLARNIGYAMVRVEHSAPGSRFDVDTPDGRRGARVVPMPFIDPGKTLARS
jgi:aminomethyltransferase